MNLDFVQSTWFTFALAVVAIGSLLFSFYSHRTNKTNQRLCYSIKGARIFQKADMGPFSMLPVTFDGNEVDRLYFFRLLIYNAGSIAIEPKDLTNGIAFGLKDEVSQDKLIVLYSKLGEIDDYDAAYKILQEDVKPRFSLEFKHIPPRSGLVIDCFSNTRFNNFFVKANTKSYGQIKNSVPNGAFLVFSFLFSMVTAIVVLIGVSAAILFVGNYYKDAFEYEKLVFALIFLAVIAGSAFFVMRMTFSLYDMIARVSVSNSIRRFTADLSES